MRNGADELSATGFQSSLAAERLLEALRHVVEGGRQLADLVCRAALDAGREVTACQSPRRAPAARVLDSRGRVELVAGAPDDFEVAGPARVALDLLAHAADVDGHSRWTAGEGLVPYGVEQFIATEHVARMRHQVMKQV